MGYESRIIVAIRRNRQEYNWIYFEKLAQMYLSRVDYSLNFPAIFTKEVETEIYGDGYEENSCDEYELTKDRYGDRCKYTDIQTVIDWLENAENRKHYRRYTPAIAMLKAYAAEQWEGELVVIHYGY